MANSRPRFQPRFRIYRPTQPHCGSSIQGQAGYVFAGASFTRHIYIYVYVYVYVYVHIHWKILDLSSYATVILGGAANRPTQRGFLIFRPLFLAYFPGFKSKVLAGHPSPPSVDRDTSLGIMDPLIVVMARELFFI